MELIGEGVEVIRVGEMLSEGNRSDTNVSVPYEALAYAYNIALSDLFTGRKQEAENCFEFIASSQCSFPLVKRVREYLLTKDISVLFSMIP